MAYAHNHTAPFTIAETVEIARAEREGHKRPPYADQAAVRQWLAEQRIRWAKEGHPDYLDQAQTKP